MRHIVKDLKKRKQFFCHEYFLRVFRVLLKNQTLKKDIRILLYNQFLSLRFNTWETTIKNYCVLTGRSRSVFRRFRISRIRFRDLAVTGVLSGVKKISW